MCKTNEHTHTQRHCTSVMFIMRLIQSPDESPISYKSKQQNSISKATTAASTTRNDDCNALAAAI